MRFDRLGLEACLPAVALWAVIHAALVALPADGVLHGNLGDTDSYMRLARVRDLVATGRWFDHTLWQANTPYGDILQWTRPFDVLLIMLMLPLRLVLDFDGALYWAGVAISPLLQLATIFAAHWAFRPLLTDDERPLAAIVLMAQPAFIIYAMPGRADHHSLIALLLVITVGWTLRSLADPASRRAALAAGLAAGFGLWATTEFVLPIAVVLASLLGAWWLGGERALLRAGLRFSGALAVVVAIATLSEHGPANLFSEEYDKIAWPYVVAFGALFVGLGLVDAWAERNGRGAAPFGRLAALAAAFGGALAVVAIFQPKLLLGPLAEVDPQVVATFAERGSELRPLWPSDRASLAWALVLIGTPVAAIPAAAILGWGELRRHRIGMWSLAALMLGVYIICALAAARFALLAELAAVPFICRTISWAGQRITTLWSGVAALIGRPVMILLTLLLPPAVGLGLLGSGSAASGAPADAVCRLRDLVPWLNDPGGLGRRPRAVGLSINYAAELLYRTPHSVIGIMGHRAGQALLDAVSLFEVPEMGEVERIIAARRIELIVICGEGAASDSALTRALAAPSLPRWATPLAAPAGSGFRVFAVDPAQVRSGN